jgi:glycogen debranching enzyme
MKRYGFAAAANQVAQGIFDAASYFESYRLPEVFAGLPRVPRSFPVQYRGANIPQAWAAGSIFELLRTILGLQADAPHQRLSVNPTLPDWLPSVRLSGLAVGGVRLDLHFWRDGSNSSFAVESQRGGEIDVVAETMHHH